MIVDFKSPFAALEESITFHFYLTGSRYFGGATAKSDWDFFVQDSSEVETYLSVFHGFKPLMDASYADAVVVYHKYINGIVIQVQLVKDINVKLKAQEMLKPFLKQIPKSHHKAMWKAALAEASK